MSVEQLYREASEDQLASGQWYGQARAACRAMAREHSVSERTAAGVVAALSPRQQWRFNLKAADMVLAARAAGKRQPPRVGIMGNVAKAWRIAGGEKPLAVLGGPKVRAFYRNITGDLDHVTVDVWAARAAGLDGHPKNVREYDAVADEYRRVAALVGIRPAQLQAIVWVVIRSRGQVRSNGVSVRGRGAHE